MKQQLNVCSNQGESAPISRRDFGRLALVSTTALASSALDFGDFGALNGSNGSRTAFGAGSAAGVDASAAGDVRAASEAPEVAASPYGVCAHLGGGTEFEQMPKNLELMRAAGIRWARADFSWSGVESKDGEWNFDSLDRTVDETNRTGIQILPILDYDVPWASPAFEHLDAWREYVRRTVERYRDRIRFWEVWNEPNLEGFWRAKPNGADYATLLKATCETIKAVDSNLVVVFAGLAGVPLDYFEAALDAGAGDFFDVVNVHPYRGGLVSRQDVERFQSDIAGFTDALRKRGIAEKPVWITEMGWATPPTFGETNRRIVDAAFQKLFGDAKENADVKLETPNGAAPKVAIFYDERYAPSLAAGTNALANLVPPSVPKENVKFVDDDALAAISPDDYQALILPPSEAFPGDRLDAAISFAKNGGALFLLGGVPLYYRETKDADGVYRREAGNPDAEKNYRDARVSWFAWWTRENTPKEVPTVVAPECAAELAGYYPVVPGTRFFDDKALKEGDRMIPILNGRNETFSAAIAAIYRFKSDYRGAIVVGSIGGDGSFGTNVSTVADQAVFLPQAYLTSFAFGVSRYFWYEFQAPEADPVDKESHFGIVGRELAPKPAYFAYKALTQARPAGSTKTEIKLTDDYCVATWKRPDGRRGFALWAHRGEVSATLKIAGTVDESFDYLGNEVAKPASGAQTTLTPGILYLVGPKSVKIA